MISLLLGVLLWPVRFLWGVLRDAVSALAMMGDHPRLGLLDGLSVLLRLVGTTGLVMSVILAVRSGASTWMAFASSAEGRGLIAVAVLSLGALGVGRWLTARVDSLLDEAEYRRYVRMRHRVEQEESRG